MYKVSSSIILHQYIKNLQIYKQYRGIPCQINQNFAIFDLTLSDFYKNLHSYRP